jgi:hypothetical protein
VALINNIDMAKKISSAEKQWQIEDDARTLARYQEIMQDSKRRNAAIKQAKTEAANLEKRANAMKMAAGGKLKK